MPNRSTGCYLCRQQKIRCDGTRPSCQRWKTHGVDCPGYQIATPRDVEFRDETQLAVERYGGSRTSKQSRRSISRAHFTPRSSSSSSSSPNSSTRGEQTPRSIALTSFNSPAPNIAQLYSGFFEIFTPKNILNHERGGIVELSNIGYLRHLAALPNCYPALTYSMSALSLVSTGSLIHDRQLLRKGIEEYAASINGLANALRKPSALHDDQILACITVLKLCEFHDEVNRHSSGWTDHSNGLQQLLANRGPDSMRGEFSAMLLANAKQASLTRSVLIRNKDFYDSQRWSQVDIDEVSYDVGTRLPSLLERHDQLDFGSRSAMREIDALLADCAVLQRDLGTYLDRHVASSLTQSGNRYDEEDVDGFSPFSDLVTDRTLRTAYRFPSFASAFLHTSFWLRMYFLRTTMASLQLHRRQLLWSLTQEAEIVVLSAKNAEIQGYIMDLCRSIPFFIDPVNGTIGHVCCFFPMVAGAKIFQENGQISWLRWIHHVRERIFDKGISLPSIEGADIPPLDNRTS